MILGYSFSSAFGTKLKKKKKYMEKKNTRGLYNVLAQRALESKTIKRRRTHCAEVKRIK